MTTAFENFEEANDGVGWDRYGSSSQVAESLANVVVKFNAGEYGEERVHGDAVRRVEAVERQRAGERQKRNRERK